MIEIFYTRFIKPLDTDTWLHYFRQLPPEMQRKNSQFIRWQDQHSHLFGRMLMIRALSKYGYNASMLSQLQYTQYGRPFLAGDIDFNISHSGEYVVCAAGKNVYLGIDIEQVRDIDFNDLKIAMTDRQWDEINQSTEPIRALFKLWTIKESVIKAERDGTLNALQNITLEGNAAYCSGHPWFIKELMIDNSYFCSLATSEPVVEVKLTEVYFNN